MYRQPRRFFVYKRIVQCSAKQSIPSQTTRQEPPRNTLLSHCGHGQAHARSTSAILPVRCQAKRRLRLIITVCNASFSMLMSMSKIKFLLADREFIGFKWMSFLIENYIPFSIRVKDESNRCDRRRAHRVPQILAV